MVEYVRVSINTGSKLNNVHWPPRPSASRAWSTYTSDAQLGLGASQLRGRLVRPLQRPVELLRRGHRAAAERCLLRVRKLCVISKARNRAVHFRTPNQKIASDQHKR